MGYRRVVVLLLVVLASPALGQRNLVVEKAAQEVRVALVIGNGAYKDAPLANPVNDAVDIANALRSAGFKVILKRNLGTRDMRQAIRDFGRELRNAHVGLLYFAGHGVQVRGNNYLIPVGTDISTEADAEDLAIDANFALRTMEESQVKVSIVILDACRNNPFARSFRSASRGLAQMTAATGTLIAFSTAPGSVASDGTGRNGVYTKHLLASLGHPDSDILRVLQRTRAGVVKETGGKQTPWESTSLVGEFYFRPGAQVATVASVAAAPVADTAAVEIAFWESVKGSNNVADFKEYLNQFPNGRFAGLARNRVAALSAPPPVAVAAVPVTAATMPSRPIPVYELQGRWFSAAYNWSVEIRGGVLRRFYSPDASAAGGSAPLDAASRSAVIEVPCAGGQLSSSTPQSHRLVVTEDGERILQTGQACSWGNVDTTYTRVR